MVWAPRALFSSSSPLPVAATGHSRRKPPTSTVPLASSSGTRGDSPRINGSTASRGKQKKSPSVAEVQRAIGVIASDDPFPSTGRGDSSSSSSSASSLSPLMEMLSSTPIGREEGPNEKKLREVAEWVVDRTESNALAGQQILLVVCLKIFPVWVLLLLIASGVIKLPFDLPFMDDLVS